MPITADHAGRRYPPTPPYEVSAAKIAEFARALGDDASWDELTDRQVQLARHAGALSLLPIALIERFGVQLFVGDLDAAASLVAEAEAVAEATGSQLAPQGAIALAAWRGREAEASALIQASREAMLNASRHGGGSVSVYLEVSGGRAEVFIKDRGPGFDLQDVPEDRMGVRESIIGRMNRHGGTATIISTTEGTEVRLGFQAAPDSTEGRP